MKDVRETYIEEGYSDYIKYGLGDYLPLIKSMGYEVVIQEDEKDYQGDSFLLLKDESRIGFLTFGWGSCSGCDALQACSTWKDVEELRDGMAASIKWFSNPVELLDYWQSKDFRTEWFGRGATWKKFKQEVYDMFTNQGDGKCEK